MSFSLLVSWLSSVFSSSQHTCENQSHKHKRNIKFSKCSIMFSMSMTKKLWYDYRPRNKVKDRWFRGSSSPTMVCMKTKYLASLHVFWGGVCLKRSSLTLSKSYVCHSGLQTSKIAWPIYWLELLLCIGKDIMFYKSKVRAQNWMYVHLETNEIEWKHTCDMTLMHGDCTNVPMFPFLVYTRVEFM
jgi:hypothetical protein